MHIQHGLQLIGFLLVVTNVVTKLLICEWYFSLPLGVAAFHQFHQYYIYGKFSDCTKYKSRVKKCLKWKTFQSEGAKVSWSKDMKLMFEIETLLVILVALLLVTSEFNYFIFLTGRIDKKFRTGTENYAHRKSSLEVTWFTS